MRTQLAVLSLTGCTGVVLPQTTGALDPAAVDSGASTSSPSSDPVCDTFTAITQPAPVGCPGGGVPSDLHPWITVEDASGGYCGVCDAGDLTFRIELINDCAVDIDVETSCPYIGSWFGGADFDEVANPDCAYTTYITTVPAGGSVVWLETVRSGVAPGEYHGSYELSGDLGTVDFVVCLE